MRPGISATTKLLVRLLAHGDDAEVGFERREGIVGDLGPRGGDARDERGLAGVGVADQADVGQQLEFEPRRRSSPAVPPRVRAGPDGCCGEVLVAASAASAFGDDDLLIGLFKIMNQLACLLIVERCADRT